MKKLISKYWNLFYIKWGRILRFGITGVANTAVYYLFYSILLALIPYVAAHLIAWVISVIFSFFANCFFTYKIRPTWQRFFAFPVSTLINLLFTTIGSIFLVQVVGFDKRYATLVMGIIAIPFTFAVTTWVLKPESNAVPEKTV